MNPGKLGLIGERVKIELNNLTFLVLFDRPIKKPQRVLNLDHVIDSRARTAPQVVIETEQLSEEDMEAKLRAEQEEKEKHRKVEEARYILLSEVISFHTYDTYKKKYRRLNRLKNNA